jgi:hypothetical protein
METMQTALVLDYVCLFTHDLRRKQKRWQDGRLRYHTFNKRVMVYDERGTFVGDTHWSCDYELREGEEFQLDRGSIIVQVSDLLGQRDQDLSELLSKRPKQPQMNATQGAPRPALAAAQPTTGPRPFSIAPMGQAHRNASSMRPMGSHPVTYTRPGIVYPASRGVERAAKRPRLDSSPTSKSGKKHYAQDLFGTTISLSGGLPSSVGQQSPASTPDDGFSRNRQADLQALPTAEGVDISRRISIAAVSSYMPPGGNGGDQQFLMLQDTRTGLVASDGRVRQRCLADQRSGRLPNLACNEFNVKQSAVTAAQASELSLSRAEESEAGCRNAAPAAQGASTAGTHTSINMQTNGPTKHGRFAQPVPISTDVQPEPQTDGRRAAIQRQASDTDGVIRHDASLAASRPEFHTPNEERPSPSEPRTKLRIKSAKRRGLLMLATEDTNIESSSEAPAKLQKISLQAKDFAAASKPVEDSVTTPSPNVDGQDRSKSSDALQALLPQINRPKMTAKASRPSLGEADKPLAGKPSVATACEPRMAACADDSIAAVAHARTITTEGQPKQNVSCERGNCTAPKVIALLKNAVNAADTGAEQCSPDDIEDCSKATRGAVTKPRLSRLGSKSVKSREVVGFDTARFVAIERQIASAQPASDTVITISTQRHVKRQEETKRQRQEPSSSQVHTSEDHDDGPNRRLPTGGSARNPQEHVFEPSEMTRNVEGSKKAANDELRPKCELVVDKRSQDRPGTMAETSKLSIVDAPAARLRSGDAKVIEEATKTTITTVVAAGPSPPTVAPSVPQEAQNSLTVANKPRIANPASRGRKAATESDAAGQVPQNVLPPDVVAVSTRASASTSKDPTKSRRTMTFPGFTTVRRAGPWSREAHDLLEAGRPGS